MSTTEDVLVSPPRCGKVLRVGSASFSMLLPGDYMCNRPAGHDPAEEHTAVVRWTEKAHVRR